MPESIGVGEEWVARSSCCPVVVDQAPAKGNCLPPDFARAKNVARSLPGEIAMIALVNFQASEGRSLGRSTKLENKS